MNASKLNKTLADVECDLLNGIVEMDDDEDEVDDDAKDEMLGDLAQDLGISRRGASIDTADEVDLAGIECLAWFSDQIVIKGAKKELSGSQVRKLEGWLKKLERYHDDYFETENDDGFVTVSFK